MSKNALPYYPRFPRDFLEGTAGMSLELKGAYGIVIDLIYMSGARGLPDDSQYVAGQLGTSVRKWNSLRKTLVDTGKLHLVSGNLISQYSRDVDARLRLDKKRSWIPLSVQRIVWGRDGKCCQYCGAINVKFHLDHITPWSRGGEDTAENLTVACQPCNLSKSDKTLSEWRASK